MYQGRTIVALIPARGGSKGLPRKNILPLIGKPLIAWSIETALASQICDQVIVSTDDQEIADIAQKYGAEVPFLRPAELATDEAKGMDVNIHAIDWLTEHGKRPDLILLLQPTSPLRKGLDIANAAKLFFEKEAACVVSVCECEHSPLWMNTLGPDLSMENFLKPEALNKNRQELRTYYRLNGAIYLADCVTLKSQKTFYGEKTFAYIMPGSRSIDIDCEFDLQVAEILLQKQKDNRKEN